MIHRFASKCYISYRTGLNAIRFVSMLIYLYKYPPILLLILASYHLECYLFALYKIDLLELVPGG